MPNTASEQFAEEFLNSQSLQRDTLPSIKSFLTGVVEAGSMFGFTCDAGQVAELVQSIIKGVADADVIDAAKSVLLDSAAGSVDASEFQTMGGAMLDGGGLKDALSAVAAGESAGGVQELANSIGEDGPISDEVKNRLTDFVTAMAELATSKGHEVMVGELTQLMSARLLEGSDQQWKTLACDLLNRAVGRDVDSGEFASIDLNKIDRSSLMEDVKSSKFDIDVPDISPAQTESLSGPEPPAKSAQSDDADGEKPWWKFW